MTMLEERLDPRPTKRVRYELVTEPDTELDELVLKHPLRIRPSGNAYTASTNAKDAAAGDFGRLPDELIAQLLEHLQAADLLRLGGTCRALHAFSRNEELWRALFVESSPKPIFTWRGTWRSTYLAQSADREPRINCSNVYSDVLHRPFYCAHVPLKQYTCNIPAKNEIVRLHDLSVEEFQSRWVNEPFILKDPVKEWPLFQTWDVASLLTTHKDVAFRAESVDWPLSTYVDYMQSTRDESPLYLFDRGFAEKMNLNITSEPNRSADYWPPVCFGFDAFSVLGKDRPDHRWLIVGPARSGSTFHQDPNGTSAWNAVIRGSKYWIMFRASPSVPPPPGVFVSADKSEVTSPLSIAEWLLGYHAEARRTPDCKEGICYEGEVLYVPSGWYHLVLNLEPSIALTQNFVPPARVGGVLRFLRDQKQSVSGFCDAIEDPYQLFVDRLRVAEPQLYTSAMAELRVHDEGRQKRWEAILKSEENSCGGGFSFGFSADADDLEVP